MNLETINGIDPECYLKYAEYVFGQRHAELIAWGPVHLGPEKCDQKYAAAHYNLNQAIMVSISDIAKFNGINIWEYSRGNPNKPDTRTMLHCFYEQGVNFPVLPWNDISDYNHIESTPENNRKIKAFHKLAQAAAMVGYKGNDPADMADFLCKKLGLEP